MLIIPKFKIKCYLLQNLVESQRLHKLPSQKAKTFFATGSIARNQALYVAGRGSSYEFDRFIKTGKWVLKIEKATNQAILFELAMNIGNNTHINGLKTNLRSHIIHRPKRHF